MCNFEGCLIYIGLETIFQSPALYSEMCVYKIVDVI